MSDEILIESVREYVVLYDPQNRYYHDNTRKENAWSEVAKKTGSSVPDCKKRWTALRDAFRKALRNKKTVSGQANIALKKWKYEDVMSFMIPFYSERGQKSNLAESQPSEQSSNNFDDDSTVLSDTENATDFSQYPLSDSNITSPATPESRASATSKSRAKTSKSTRQQNTPMAQVLQNYFNDKQASKVDKKKDHLQKFFDAMEETVRTFSPCLQIEIKSKISSLVSEYEMKNLVINQIPTTTLNNGPVQHQMHPLSNSRPSSVSCSPLVSPRNQENYANQWLNVSSPSTSVSNSALGPRNENLNIPW